MADELQIRVRAVVNTDKIKQELNSNTFNINVNLSPESINNIRNQLSQISNLKNNINIGINAQQINQQVSAVSDTIKTEMQKINQTAAVQPQVKIDLSQIKNEEDLIKSETDVLINQMIAKLKTLDTINYDSFIKNLKTSLGAANAEVKQDATALVQALKLTPNDANAIYTSYENLMDSIRNTVLNGNVVQGKGYDNRLVISIYDALATQQEKVKQAVAQIQSAEQSNINTNQAFTESNKRVTESLNQMASAELNVKNSFRGYFDSFLTQIAPTENAVDRLKAAYANLGDVTATTRKGKQTDGVIEHFSSIALKVKYATGEVQNFNYAFKNVGTKDNPAYAYVLKNIDELDAGILKLQQDITNTQSKLKTALGSFKQSHPQLALPSNAQWFNEISAIEQKINNINNAQSMKSVQADMEAMITKARTLDSQLKNTISNSQNTEVEFYQRIANLPKSVNELQNSFSKLNTPADKLVASFDKGKEQAQTIKQHFADLQKELNVVQQGLGNGEGYTEKWNNQAIQLVSHFNQLTSELKYQQSLEKANANNSLVQNTSAMKAQLLAIKKEYQDKGIYTGEIQKQLSSMINHVGSITKVEKLDEYNQKIQVLTSNVKGLVSNLDKQVESQNRINNLQSQLALLNPDKINNKAYLEEQLAAEQKKLSNYQMSAVTMKNILSLDEQDAVIKQRTAESAERLALAQERAKDSQTAKDTQQLNNYLSTLNSVINSLQSIKNNNVFTSNSNNTAVQTQTKEIENLIAKAKEAKDNVSKILSGNIDTNEVANLLRPITELKNRVDEVKISAGELKGQLQFSNTVEKYNAELQTTSEKWRQQGLLIGEIQNKLNAIKGNTINITNAEQLAKSKSDFDNLVASVKAYQENLSISIKLQNELNNKKAQLEGANTPNVRATIESEISALEKKLSDYDKEAEKLQNIVSLSERQNAITIATTASANRLNEARSRTQDNQIQNEIKQLQNYQNEIDRAINKLNVLKRSLSNQRNVGNIDVQNQISQIDILISKLSEGSLNIKNFFSSGNNVNNVSADLQKLSADSQQLITAFNTANTSFQNFQTNLRNTNNIESYDRNVKILISRIQAFAVANTKAMKSEAKLGSGLTTSQEINNMLAQLRSGNADIATVRQNFQLLRSEVKRLGIEGGTVFQNLWESVKKFGRWMGITNSITRITMQIRNAVTEIKSLDDILTEISKTSDRTKESLMQLGETSFATASLYGRTASDYLTGVQEMSRAGFSETQSENLAQLSLLAQSAGDMEAELANQYLIATNAAYKYNGDIEKLNKTLDSQNYITNNNALSMTDLAEATKLAASQAAQAGVGTDELTAALGTMIATTQQGGEVAARAFRGKRTLCAIAHYGCESIVA